MAGPSPSQMKMKIPMKIDEMYALGVLCDLLPAIF